MLPAVGQTRCRQSPGRRPSGCHRALRGPVPRCAVPRSHAQAAAAGRGPLRPPQRARCRTQSCRPAAHHPQSHRGAHGSRRALIPQMEAIRPI
eukprot:7376948-Prymnesium_polylepis.1